MRCFEGLPLLLMLSLASSLKFDVQEIDYNLNQNQAASNPLDYWGEWPSHTYYESPSNWRFPFYTLFLDKFVNGDPSNDNANGTAYEQDVNSSQFRHGGDLAGLIDTLDYIQGMGIQGLYIAGTPFLNLPWKADGYSPLDLTLLDRHFGNILEWRIAISEIHRRGMYVVLDNTMSTLGNLVGFEGFLNTSAPFLPTEHKALWKSDRRYPDFSFGNTYNTTCEYPRFWNESGFRVTKESDLDFSKLVGCYDSEFDQYGDTEAFGVFPDWQRQLSKFASVQDRLREWVPSVREKIQQFSCITIAMLDIDGFRFDKATQVTVDAQAEFGDFIRQCAARFNKSNFFIPGEITGGNTFGSIYLGRGRQPDQVPENLTLAVTLNTSDNKYFLRDAGKNALDGAAFHYSIYRSLVRFLGMDGNLTAGYDVPVNFVDTWNLMLTTNDFINPNTRAFDPRHMYGVTNQDVFRWPAIKDGTQKMLLGLFISTLHMPGIPLLLWGEEQALYVLDNTADNYIFGRQPISSTPAWQMNGCYTLGSSQYYDFPVESALKGCEDDTVSLDHRDPSHPVRNIIKSMYHLRSNYPVLNDGYFLQSLSNQTREVFLPGSNGTATETGMWSVMRNQFLNVQDLNRNQSVWLVYQNDQATKYTFNCSSNTTSLIAPFDSGTTVKNLLAPYDEIKLKAGPKKLGIDGSEEFNGCLDELELAAYAFKAYVPKSAWISPPPMVSKFLPGHDSRLVSKTGPGEKDSVEVELHFSEEMDCDQVTRSIFINSTSSDGTAPQLDNGTVSCARIATPELPQFVGGVPSVWAWKGTLLDVLNGIHALTIRNATTSDGKRSTTSTDRFLFRIGLENNAMVFPRLANYSQETLFRNKSSGDLFVSHSASGADKWRYSLNWESSWSDWEPYTGGNSTLAKQPWSGTKRQRWSGDHVVLQYWSRLAGSSSTIQHADLNDQSRTPGRFPHLFAHGPFNQFGFDGGLDSAFNLGNDGLWKFHLMTEWPSTLQVNVWGVNPDGQPDQTIVFGDVDNNNVLDRMLPDALGETVVNFTNFPPSPYLAYRLELSDSTYRYQKVPVGSRFQQLILYALLWSIPLATGIISIWAYMGAFYSVKLNKIGIKRKMSLIPFTFRRDFVKLGDNDEDENSFHLQSRPATPAAAPVPIVAMNGAKRTILIATMEYDIEDWNIKIKIGGLGVMAQLMGKSLAHQDLVWVVPCVGGVDYPVDNLVEPMNITILDVSYEIQVQYHRLRNITYVLLDAPIFRQQTKAEPYPPRMDDLDSAVYYSAWNACIAETIKRFPIDLYHINDYHGAAAPLYLLPRTIPCVLSLHNAEFQGLWPMRNPKEVSEVCKVFNIEPSIVQRYIQFGEVFNLLHAAASYLRVHQKGFGAVGVSNKYGERSYARYPIFWGLKKIGKLPNPDPSDTEPWNEEEESNQVIEVNADFENSRGALRQQAQEWAGLEINPDAELFVFVGRWSNQKGIDLIADVFPAVLEKHSTVQLICVGPTIDLYGKFAALKLAEISKRYSGRVYSKPEFTALPPFIFTGAEFALIPSRDEPFGLVAVEFGRKGALGVGARVGGLGQMPGWWFTVESTTTKHLHRQFKKSIEEALASKKDVRALMRARSAKQRFPVAKWVEDLNSIQSAAIKIHQEEAGSVSVHRLRLPSHSRLRFSSQSRNVSNDRISMYEAEPTQGDTSRAQSLEESPSGVIRSLSLGVRNGPGHRSSFVRNIGPEAGVDESNVDIPDMDVPAEYTITQEEAEATVRADRINQTIRRLNASDNDPSPPRTPREALLHSRGRSISRTSRPPSLLLSRDLSIPRASESSPPLSSRGRSRSRTQGSSPAGSPEPRGRIVNRREGEGLLSTSPATPSGFRSSSVLSLSQVKGTRNDYSLQKVDPTFNDTNGKYYRSFEEKLQNLDGKTSEGELCIEEYLIDSEKEWFKRLRNAKLGRSHEESPRPCFSGRDWVSLPFSSAAHERPLTANTTHSNSQEFDRAEYAPPEDEFLLGKNYMRESFLKRLMLTRIADWPIYSLLLALGQIIAANSYQITLLTGGQGQTDKKLYVIGTIYIVTSGLWWLMFRSLKSKWVLSVPFAFYGLAFFFVGMSVFLKAGSGRDWMRNVATAMYTTASSSGSLFFSLNFGDEGGAPIKAWVYRACIIQGTQQIYVTALFYWGSTIAAESAADIANSMSASTTAAITLPIAGLLWLIGVILLTSLPAYYHQSPGKIPSFYKTLLRRKIIGWFFIAIVLQNYFLSAPYGRSWAYLWSSKYTPRWAIALLVLAFFIVTWVLFLALFGQLSKSHSWILPIFAIGLGAPRWAQILWGTSGFGLWLPWFPGGPVSGALAGRALWLWLGLLDSIQGVGFGMILLQTLTRIHIGVCLIVAQILGTLITMFAKGTAPDKDGPGDVFPDFSAGVAQAFAKPWFWIALGCQLVIPVGFFKFFRKEQLSKP